ncbi:MAG: septum formation protein Maf [Treponema sp.]|nr:MAG: septum formation protein Maf [Treponema sp.]
MLLLASKSTERKKLLESLRVICESAESGLDEEALKQKLAVKNLTPIELAVELALAKLKATIDNYDTQKYAMVLTADTMIYIDKNTIFGKPKTAQEAKSMLSKYSNNTHNVVTALAAYNPKTKATKTTTSVSKVTFKQLAPNDISCLLASQEWKTAAGAYRIQGLAAKFIDKTEGSYTGVIGLPADEFLKLAKDLKTEHSEIFY